MVCIHVCVSVRVRVRARLTHLDVLHILAQQGSRAGERDLDNTVHLLRDGRLRLLAALPLSSTL